MKWFYQLIKKIVGVEEEEVRIKEIRQRLDQLENRQTSEPEIKYIINVDKVYLTNPKLDKIEFRLDTLDIDTLSGVLNLGNNFTRQLDPNEIKEKKTESKGRLVNAKILKNNQQKEE